MTQPATVGSHLLYTYQAADHCEKSVVGQSRPAVVVKDWGSCYNITVFTDGSDFRDNRATLTRTSVQLSDLIAKGRLCWPGSPLEAPVEAPASEPEAQSSESAGETAPDGVPPAEPTAPEHIQTTVAPPEVLARSGRGSGGTVAPKKPGRPKK